MGVHFGNSGIELSERLKQQIQNPKPDVQEFLSVIAGRKQPQRVHLAELFADDPFMAYIGERILGIKWYLPGAEEKEAL